MINPTYDAPSFVEVEQEPADAPKIEPRLRLMTSSELAMADLSVDWFVKSVLIKGQPMIVGGMSKTLKTSLMVDLAISVASGTDFLNEFETTNCNVLFISGESGLATLRAKANAICINRGISLEQIDNSLIWCDTIPTLTNGADLDELEQIFIKHEIDLILVDPVYLALGGGDDMNNVMAQGEKLRTFSNLCQASDVTAILCHHAKKTIVHNNPMELNDLAGAGFQEFARQWFLINRREAWDNGSHKLWINYGGSYGHGRTMAIDIDEGQFDPEDQNWRCWDLTVMDVTEARKSAQERTKASKEQKWANAIHEAKEKILKAMNNFKENKDTAAQIAAAAGMGKGGKAFNEALGELIRCGDLVPCKVTKNGKDHDGYQRLFKVEQIEHKTTSRDNLTRQPDL